MGYMHRLLKPVSVLGAVAVLLASTLAHAQTPWSEGEVRKVDKTQQKVTIKHGGIGNLDMPPMTMVFRVRARPMLEGLAPGTQVRFRAERIDSQYTLTQIEVRR